MKLIEFTDYHDNPVYINPHYVVRGNVKDVINLLQRK
jgi:hypothetical protein